MQLAFEKVQSLNGGTKEGCEQGSVGEQNLVALSVWSSSQSASLHCNVSPSSPASSCVPGAAVPMVLAGGPASLVSHALSPAAAPGLQRCHAEGDSLQH